MGGYEGQEGGSPRGTLSRAEPLERQLGDEQENMNSIPEMKRRLGSGRRPHQLHVGQGF